VVGIPAPLHQAGQRWDRVVEVAQGVGTLEPELLFDMNVELLVGTAAGPGGDPPARLEVDGNGFARVRAVGCGLRLAKRAVIEELVAAYPETWVADYRHGAVPCVFCALSPERDAGRHVATSDYVAFGERLRALGRDVWVDLTRTLGHNGRVTFDSQDYGKAAARGVSIAQAPWADDRSVRARFPNFISNAA